jgi:hypothetical protein
LLKFDRCPVHRGVELMICVRVFDDTRALARFRKSLRILAARRYGSKIVGCPVQHEDRFLHVLLIAKARIANAVGGYVSDELQVRVMRMRRGTQTRDLFATRHILITRNALLCESAKQFCISRGLNARTSVGPAIHQRQLATAVWLRTGLSDIQQDIPRRYLLAACERVLELKKTVVDQVRIISRTLTREKAQQLDLLLTQDRSTQLLMDKTLGSSNVVNANNIEPLIEEMRRTLTESIETEAAATIATAQKDAAAKVRKANERRKLTEQENAALLSSLAQSEGDDAHMVDALLAEVNREMSRRRWQTRLVVGGVILLVGVLPLLTDRLSNTSKVVCLAGAGVIGAVFAGLQLFDVPVGIEGRIIRWGQSRLIRLAEQRGIKSKLDKYPVEQSGLLFRRSRLLTLD